MMQQIEAVVESELEVDVSRTMRQVRRAIVDLIDALPVSIRKPAELRSAFSLDKKLAWQIFTIVNASNSDSGDMLAASRYVPGSPSLTRFLSAVAGSGVSATRVDAVRDAVETFNQLVTIHASDRAEFDSLISAISPGETSVREEANYRKTAYRSESHIWGVQVGVAAQLLICKLSESGEGFDICSIHSKLGYHRLRPDAPLRVLSFAHSDAKDVAIPDHQLLDVDAFRIHGAPILPQFCSSPLPSFKTIENDDSYWNHVVAEGRSVGRRSAVDLTFGNIHRHSTLVPSHDEAKISLNMHMTAPSALLVNTMMIHRPTLGKPAMTLEIYKPGPGDGSPIADRSYRLPAYEPVEFIGSGADGVYCGDVPRYPDTATFVCSKLGWNSDEFDVYRLRLPFPVLHSVIQMTANFDERLFRRQQNVQT